MQLHRLLVLFSVLDLQLVTTARTKATVKRPPSTAAKAKARVKAEAKAKAKAKAKAREAIPPIAMAMVTSTSGRLKKGPIRKTPKARSTPAAGRTTPTKTKTRRMPRLALTATSAPFAAFLPTRPAWGRSRHLRLLQRRCARPDRHLGHVVRALQLHLGLPCGWQQLLQHRAAASGADQQR